MNKSKSPRSFMVMTGQHGMLNYTKAIKEHFIVEDLNQLYQHDHITGMEYSRMLDMIQSDHRDDFTLAETIIEAKLKENNLTPTAHELDI